MNFGGSWTSSTTNYAGNGYSDFDDFTLAKNSTVTGIDFVGGAFDTDVSNWVSTALYDFDVAVTQSSAGTPSYPTGNVGNAGVSHIVGATLGANREFVSYEDAGGGHFVTRYRYHATLTTPLVLAGNTRFWLSLTARPTASNLWWAWSSGTTAAGSLDYAHQYGWGASGIFYVSQRPSRAFTLIGEAVPEPASLGALGLGALGLLRRRDRGRK